MLYNLKSIIEIINRKIEYNLKPAYKRMITELYLRYYIDLKKIYNRLRNNLRDQKNKIANFITEIKKLQKKKKNLKERFFITACYNIAPPAFTSTVIKSPVFKPGNSYQ